MAIKNFFYIGQKDMTNGTAKVFISSGGEAKPLFTVKLPKDSSGNFTDKVNFNDVRKNAKSIGLNVDDFTGVTENIATSLIKAGSVKGDDKEYKDLITARDTAFSETPEGTQYRSQLLSIQGSTAGRQFFNDMNKMLVQQKELTVEKLNLQYQGELDRINMNSKQNETQKQESIQQLNNNYISQSKDLSISEKSAFENVTNNMKQSAIQYGNQASQNYLTRAANGITTGNLSEIESDRLVESFDAVNTQTLQNFQNTVSQIQNRKESLARDLESQLGTEKAVEIIDNIEKQDPMFNQEAVRNVSQQFNIALPQQAQQQQQANQQAQQKAASLVDAQGRPTVSQGASPLSSTFGTSSAVSGLQGGVQGRVNTQFEQQQAILDLARSQTQRQQVVSQEQANVNLGIQMKQREEEQTFREQQLALLQKQAQQRASEIQVD